MVRQWRALCSSMITIVVTVGLVVTGPAQPAAAEGTRGAAFVWNWDATREVGSWYTPTDPWQYNSTSPGNPNNSIMRRGTGTYFVQIPGLVGFGATHATAYGWDAAYCNAGDIVAETFSLVDVRCYNASGNLIDHMFTLSFTNVNEPGPGQHMAYMEVLSDGTILPFRHFNSGGGLSTVTRQGSAYVVRIPGIGSNFGHVQVTAAGISSRCKVTHWFPSDSDQIVVVNCWHGGWFNAPENAPFVLTYVNQQNILGLPAGTPPSGHPSAYAWADQPSSIEEYTPHGFYQFTSSGYQATTASFGVGTGRYLMSFHGVDLNNGNVQVTAYGSGQEFCAVNYWSGSNAQVQCYGWDGTPVDTFYTVAFTGL